MIQIYPDEKSGNLKKVSAFFIIQHGIWRQSSGSVVRIVLNLWRLSSCMPCGE